MQSDGPGYMCHKNILFPDLNILSYPVCYHCSTIADDSDQMEEHASVKQLKMSSEQGGAVTLEECFEVMVLIKFLVYDFFSFLLCSCQSPL